MMNLAKRAPTKLSTDRLWSRLPLSEIRVGARFLRRLPGFLRFRIDPPAARAVLQRRLAHREDDFLSLAQTAIYRRSQSVYRRLLALAGCEYGDLESLVRRHGLTETLETLLRQGVYLTVDELKGRTPVVRSGTSIEMRPESLHNPLVGADLLRYRSGSRGGQTPVPIGMDQLLDRSVNICLIYHARGGIGWQHGYWEVPGGAAMLHVLECHPFQGPPVRWFSQLDPATPGLHPRYRWSVRLTRWAAAAAGADLPRPRYVSLNDPLPIIEWMLDELRHGETPHLKTYASSAARLGQVAYARGIDLTGAHFTVTGEPVTEARLAAVGRTGARATPRCGTSEGGLIGSGCLSPEACDELHFFHDLNAVIQPGAGAPGNLAPHALLLTSLRRSARLILLNASLGDEALVSARTCGCPMEHLGWTTHLHSLRSREKLTAAGMSFLDLDIVRVLEQVLPGRFGGGPTDYQLVEDVGRDGRPRLRLLVDPAVGTVDPQRVAADFLSAIGPGSGAERLMGLLWKEAGLLEVERRSPLQTPAGKILHIHRDQSPPAV
jgi:hypothetical protein